MLKFRSIKSGINISSYTTQKGSEEHYITLTPNSTSGFKEDCDNLLKRYQQALSCLGLSVGTQVHSRLFLSDIANQIPVLKNSKFLRLLGKGACSIIEQKPLQGGCISLLSYHIKSKSGNLVKKQLQLEPGQGLSGIFIKGCHYEMLWISNLGGDGVLNSNKQTKSSLQKLDAIIQKNKMVMDANLIRTWIYIRDIDNHYEGMVKARKEFYLKKGLTQNTHYPASTGIEGRCSNANALVSIDSLSFKGLQKEQVVKMEALNNLSPTIKYGVTFERGMKLKFGDRNHLYISGTASINNKGELLHPGNLKKQTLRTLKNIQALLKPHQAGLKDVACAVAYVRDSNAKHQVKKILDEALPQMPPFVMAEAPVCRPGWLVEVECVAIIKAENPYPYFI